MDKQKLIKKQTWKFFWEQKREEMESFLENILIGLILLLIIFSFMGFIGGIIYIIDNEQSTKWLFISGICTTSFWIIFGVGSWLNSNWKKAKGRAKEKYNKKKIKGKKK